MPVKKSINQDIQTKTYVVKIKNYLQVPNTSNIDWKKYKIGEELDVLKESKFHLPSYKKGKITNVIEYIYTSG